MGNKLLIEEVLAQYSNKITKMPAPQRGRLESLIQELLSNMDNESIRIGPTLAFLEALCKGGNGFPAEPWPIWTEVETTGFRINPSVLLRKLCVGGMQIDDTAKEIIARGKGVGVIETVNIAIRQDRCWGETAKELANKAMMNPSLSICTVEMALLALLSKKRTLDSKWEYLFPVRYTNNVRVADAYLFLTKNGSNFWELCSIDAGSKPQELKYLIYVTA